MLFSPLQEMAVGIVLATAVLLLVLFLFLQFQWRQRHILKAARKLPCPPTYPILGNALLFVGGISTIRNVIIELAAQFHELFCLWIGPVPLFVVLKPDDVQIVLNSSTVIEKDQIYQHLRPFIGNSIILSSAPIWKKYRRLINPMYHPNYVEEFLPAFNELSRQMTDKFGKTSKLDPCSGIFNLTVDAATKTFICTQASFEEKVKTTLYSILSEVGSLTVLRFVNVWLQVDWIFKLLHGKQFNQALEGMKTCKEAFTEIVKEYKDRKTDEVNSAQKSERHFAHLSCTIPDEPQDNHTWWDEAIMSLAAATDTNTSSMTFFLLTIAIHQDVQTKIRQEILEVMGDSRRDVTIKDIDSLNYLNQAFTESMRLHGVFAVIVRQATKDTKLTTATLPAGSRVLIPLLAMGWNPKTFPEPHKFQPDRFSPENASGRHKYAFIPFSAGPRNCIGKRYAVLLMKTVMVHILRRFEVRTQLRMEDIEYELKVIMFSKNPVLLEFVPL